MNTESDRPVNLMEYKARKYEGLHFAPFSLKHRPRELIMNFVVFEDWNGNPKYIEIDTARKNPRPQAKYLEAEKDETLVRSSPNSLLSFVTFSPSGCVKLYS